MTERRVHRHGPYPVQAPTSPNPGGSDPDGWWWPEPTSLIDPDSVPDTRPLPVVDPHRPSVRSLARRQEQAADRRRDRASRRRQLVGLVLAVPVALASLIMIIGRPGGTTNARTVVVDASPSSTVSVSSEPSSGPSSGPSSEPGFGRLADPSSGAEAGTTTAAQTSLAGRSANPGTGTTGTTAGDTTPPAATTRSPAPSPTPAASTSPSPTAVPSPSPTVPPPDPGTVRLRALGGSLRVSWTRVRATAGTQVGCRVDLTIDGGPQPRQVRSVTTDQSSGSFSLRVVAPGTYRAVKVCSYPGGTVSATSPPVSV